MPGFRMAGLPVPPLVQTVSRDSASSTAGSVPGQRDGVMLSEANHLGSTPQAFAADEMLHLRVQHDTVFLSGH